MHDSVCVLKPFERSMRDSSYACRFLLFIKVLCTHWLGWKVSQQQQQPGCRSNVQENHERSTIQNGTRMISRKLRESAQWMYQLKKKVTNANNNRISGGYFDLVGYVWTLCECKRATRTSTAITCRFVFAAVMQKVRRDAILRTQFCKIKKAQFFSNGTIEQIFSVQYEY